MSASPNNPALGSAKSPPLVPPHSPGNRPFPATDHRDLETLLALSSLHEQIRRRRTQELNKGGRLGPDDSWELKQFAHDEVLQLVAERALTVTGADGVAVALVDGSGIVCRASAGKIAPELGARLDPYSGFSGACLRTGAIVRCDDSDKDNRVNPESCRRLGTRSMVAVPLTTPEAIIGVLEAFSTEPFGFNDSDVRSLNLLSELILDAMKPEDEIRLAEISQKVVRPGSEPGSEPAPGRTPALATQPKPAELAPSILPAAPHPPGSSPPQHSSNFPSWRDSDGVKQNAKLVFFSDYDQIENSRPGLKLVIVLVMLAFALGIGLWWQIRHNINLKVAHSNPSPIKTAPTTPAPISPSPQVSDVSDPSSAQIGAEGKENNAAIQSAGDPKYPAIIGIRHWSSPMSSTVVIDLEDQVQYEAHRLTGPERIYFDLLDTKLAHGLFGKIIEVNDPVLQRIRVAQPKQGVTRVVLDTKGASNYSVRMEQEPFRLVVEVGKLGSKVGPNSKLNLFGPNQLPDSSALFNTASSQRAESPIAQVSATSPHADRSKAPTTSLPPGPTIVLDAGHGGWDLGTVGSKGLEEKDLVLDIVQRLGGMLEKKLNARVIYTRPDDSYVALEKRAEIANVAKANLFISIHANYSGSASARGVETYYTNTYSSIKARPPDADGESYVQNIDWTRVDIREKVQESHRLADCVQQALYGTVKSTNPGVRDRGVKEAQYVVLTGTSMPAILAEVSFVSSPADENELQNPAYRQRIAESLYKGIARYHDMPRHSTVASLQ